MNTYSFSAEATQDLDDIYKYIAKNNDRAASKMLNTVQLQTLRAESK